MTAMEIDQENPLLRRIEDSSISEEAIKLKEQRHKEEYLQQCRNAVSQDPTNYYLHLNVIGALQNLKDQEKLHRAQDHMHRIFVIPPTVWLEWIRNELLYILSNNNTISSSSSSSSLSSLQYQKEFDRILYMFICASKDFKGSAEFWLWYLKFILGKISKEMVLVSTTTTNTQNSSSSSSSSSSEKVKTEQISDSIPLFQNIDTLLENSKSISWDNYKDIISYKRSVFKEAAEAVGYDFSNGPSVWELYREFETKVLEKYVEDFKSPEKREQTPELVEMEGTDSEDESENEKEEDKKVSKVIENQTKVLRSIWRQQLSCPHIGIQDTYSRYQAFEENLTGKQSSEYKNQYLKAKKLVKKMEPFELELQEMNPCAPGYADADRYQEWSDYISTMKKLEQQKLPLIQNLYERALLDCFFYEKFWLEYSLWLQESNNKTASVQLLEKSIRVLPRSSYLLCALIQAHEINGSSDSIMEEFFQRIAFPDKTSTNSDIAMKNVENESQTAQTGNTPTPPPPSVEKNNTEDQEMEEKKDVHSKKKSKKKRRQHKRQDQNDEISSSPAIVLNSIDEYVSVGLTIVDFYRRKMLACVNEYYDYTDACLYSNTKSPSTKGLDEACSKKIESWFGRLEAIVSTNPITNLTLQLYGYYADFYSRFVGDIEKARQGWERMLLLQGKDWRTWSTVIEWEEKFGVELPIKVSTKTLKRCGNPELLEGDMASVKRHLRNIYQIRRLYRTAVSKLTSELGLVYIGEQFKEFERRCGDIKSLRDAEMALQEKLDKETKASQKKKPKKRKKLSDEKEGLEAEKQPEQDKTQPLQQEEPSKNVVNQNTESEPPTKRRKMDSKIDEKDITSTKDMIGFLPLDQNNQGDVHPERQEQTTQEQPNMDMMDVENHTHQTNTEGEIKENEKKEKPPVTNQSLRTVFVLNFRKNCKEEELRGLFSKFGQVVDMRLPWDSSSKKPNQRRWKGYGYIEFRRPGEAENCIQQLNGRDFQGKILTVQRYRPKHTPESTVYIRGLKNMNHQEADQCIRTVLSRCGEIVEIRLSKDTKDQTLKGFAYVQLDSEESVQKALAKDKTIYENKVIEVKPYQHEDQRVKKPSKNDRNSLKNKERKRINLGGNERLDEQDTEMVERNDKSNKPESSARKELSRLQPRAILLNQEKNNSSTKKPN